MLTCLGHCLHWSHLDCSMCVPQDIVVNITESGDNLPEVFCLFLAEIFSCNKSDIIDLIAKLETDDLLILRQYLFDKLCEQQPTLQGRILRTRRKTRVYLEDIYIIGYSLISNLEDRRIKSLLKPVKGTLDVSHTLTCDSDTEQENTGLIQICADLKLSVSSLVHQVEKLKTRVISLEKNEIYH